MSAGARALVIVASHHHGSTEKVARAFASALGADVRHPGEIESEALRDYDARHHEELLRLAEALPQAQGRKAFIFSTDGMPIALAGKSMVAANSASSHAELRARLVSAGYEIVGEFGCAGFNTNSFLKLFGGINKGRPNDEDIEDAEEFAKSLGREGEPSGSSPEKRKSLVG